MLSAFVGLATLTGVVARQQVFAVTAAALPGVVAAADYNGKCESPDLDRSNCGIIAYLLTFINVLSALVGLVVVIMIAIAGIQYSAARDNPQASVNAKNKIRDALLALVGYLFIYAFLQYIVPGGVL